MQLLLLDFLFVVAAVRVQSRRNLGEEFCGGRKDLGEANSVNRV